MIAVAGEREEKVEEEKDQEEQEERWKIKEGTGNDSERTRREIREMAKTIERS